MANFRILPTRRRISRPIILLRRRGRDCRGRGRRHLRVGRSTGRAWPNVDGKPLPRTRYCRRPRRSSRSCVYIRTEWVGYRPVSPQKKKKKAFVVVVVVSDRVKQYRRCTRETNSSIHYRCVYYYTHYSNNNTHARALNSSLCRMTDIRANGDAESLAGQ